MAQSGYLSMQVELARGGLAELCGADVKYWAGEGLPTFEGGLEGFAEAYPEVMEELLACGAVRKVERPAHELP